MAGKSTAIVATCCNQEQLRQQKEMMEHWDHRLLQIQLNYFGPSYGCEFCQDKPPTKILKIDCSYRDLIVSYWISLRGIIPQKDMLISLLMQKDPSTANLINVTMQDVIKLVESTKDMKENEHYNTKIVETLSKTLNQLSQTLNPQDKIHIRAIDGSELKLILRKNVFGVEKKKR